MADNKENKVLNVPALRFPEFSGEWNFELLDTIAPNITSGKSKPSIGEYNLYGSTGIIGKTANADYSGDMLLVARVGANAGSLQLVNDNCGITDNTLIIKPCKLSSHYLYFYLQHYNLNRLVFGSGQPLITASMLKKVRIPFGNQLEQRKIEQLLVRVDERISTQNKIIEKLETLIKGIRNYVLNNKLQNTTKKKLGELCTITTGKLDANAMKSEGLYPFFTCAEEVYRIDSFAFDTEALLVSGNGANLGYIHYYKGKFNAYQRTYVLSNFIEDIHYIQIYLEAYLHKRIALEKSTSNTPYIVLATLAEMPIIIPNIKIQKDISNKILILKSKLITEIHIRNCYKDMRQFLLSQMFI